MKNEISDTITGLKSWLESDEMCYMAINGGFEFEIKNKLAFWLQHYHSKSNNEYFVKEAKIGTGNKSKIVDIISITVNETVNDNDVFYIDGETKRNKVGCAIELGHNYLSQPVAFTINKTTSDIMKCHNAGISKNLYILHIVTDIIHIDNTARYFFKRSYLGDVKRQIRNNNSLNRLTKIRALYKNLDEDYKELTFNNNWNNFKAEIHIFIIKA